MLFLKIWQRYVFKELFTLFALVLGAFFFLYSLIDYSLHMQDFIGDKGISFSHIALYYTFQFVKRAGLLLPLALLIATIKVLFSMNQRGELVALQASGLRLKKILSPFFFLASLALLFNLLSAEFFLPASLNYLDRFRELHFKHSHRGNRKEPVHILPLKDRSKIVYRTEEAGRLTDVFWIRSADDVWRMKHLDVDQAVGSFVDHLQRNASGNFEKTGSFETYPFTSFKWEKDPIGKGEIPLENRKITALYKRLVQPISAYERAQLLTHLLFKCLSPLLSLLVLLAIIPFCLRHTRTPPLFLTYAAALFGFIAFAALLDAAVILGENRVLPPSLCLFVPVVLSFLGWGYTYHTTLKRV